MPESTPEPVELREARLDRREHDVRRQEGDMLDRMDAVMTRMENALGLPPWEEEAKPKAALRLVAPGDDA